MYYTSKKTMINNRTPYETKYYGDVNFHDYYDLSNHPLFISLSKKQKPYLLCSEVPKFGYEKVASLSAITKYLRENIWHLGDRYWPNISHTIINILNCPF